MQNVVQETKDYKKFSFMVNNRTQNEGHINALKTAFEEIGNLTKVQPILVNEKFQIIDGQHRFIACKELEAPIFYTQVKGLGIRDAQKMNVLHRSWTADDYVRSYALGGDRNYQRYQQLREDYGFSHSLILMAVYGPHRKKDQSLHATLKNGDLAIDDETLASAKERLDKLADVVELAPVAKTKAVGQAFLQIAESDNYDHKRMLSKLKMRADTIEAYQNVFDNQRQLEDVYNYNAKEGGRKRLY